MKKYSTLFLIIFLVSCTSTKSTIQNIDNNAIKPAIRENSYIITEYAKDSKYGYDADYPINIGLILEKQEETYIAYYFNGLEGPNGEKLSFKKVDTCCPFPTTHTTMGAGTLAIYEVFFDGKSKNVKLHFNIYEKGAILCPKGFSIKKQPKRDL